MRSDNLPADGAMSSNVAVHGSSRKPAPMGSLSKATWSIWAMKNTDPYSAADNNAAATTPARNWRDRKCSVCSIGEGACDCQTTKPAIMPAAATSAVVTSVLVQPTSLPRVRPQTATNAAPATRTVPRTSIRRRSPRDSEMTAMTIGIDARPMGTLIQNTHCHDRCCVTSPPTTGPAITASPVIPSRSPIAAPAPFEGRDRDHDRQADRQDDCTADTLDTASRYQRLDVLRHPGERRADNEDADADDEHSAAAIPVAECGSGHQHRREAGAVCRHRPLKIRCVDTQRASHRVQRRGDDEQIQRHHERRDRRHGEHEPFVTGPAGSCWSVSSGRACTASVGHDGDDPYRCRNSSLHVTPEIAWPVSQGDRPRLEVVSIHELELDALAQTGEQCRPVSGEDRCTRNSYSSISPRSANARGSVTPPTHNPSPGSCLSR